MQSQLRSWRPSKGIGVISLTLALHTHRWHHDLRHLCRLFEHLSLENFIPFEKCKRCTKRKYFVVWVVSHFTYNIVMCKRVKLNSYEPFVRDKIMKFVTHSWYDKIFPFGTTFDSLKRNKTFQCRYSISMATGKLSKIMLRIQAL